MAPKIPPQVLLSLGLTSGCQKCVGRPTWGCAWRPPWAPLMTTWKHRAMRRQRRGRFVGWWGYRRVLGPCLLVLPNPDWDTDNRAFDDDRIRLGALSEGGPPGKTVRHLLLLLRLRPPDKPESDDPSQPASDQGNTADEARSRVLARGVLPADVAALLKRILG